MGYGDDIIATGLARGAKERGKRVAFGDGKKIIWGPWSEEMFDNNPNIAPPKSEGAKDLEWVHHCKGHRLYNSQKGSRWVWNYEFKVTPGEFFFSEIERRMVDYVRAAMDGFIVIEPNVPWQKSVAVNKDWGENKYQQLAKQLMDEGCRVVQFIHKNSRYRLRGVTTLQMHKFREVIAHLSLANLYIGPEGGMHHAAAAVGVPAVVLFGGFIPPVVMGYDNHINLTGNSKQACGNMTTCLHCRSALDSISVDEVKHAAMKILQ